MGYIFQNLYPLFSIKSWTLLLHYKKSYGNTFDTTITSVNFLLPNVRVVSLGLKLHQAQPIEHHKKPINIKPLSTTLPKKKP